PSRASVRRLRATPAEGEQPGGHPGEPAEEEERAGEADGGEGAGDQGTGRRSDLDTEREPAERRASMLAGHEEGAERIGEGDRAPQTQREQAAEHEQAAPARGEPHGQTPRPADEPREQEQPRRGKLARQARRDRRRLR